MNTQFHLMELWTLFFVYYVRISRINKMSSVNKTYVNKMQCGFIYLHILFSTSIKYSRGNPSGVQKCCESNRSI